MLFNAEYFKQKFSDIQVENTVEEYEEHEADSISIQVSEVNSEELFWREEKQLVIAKIKYIFYILTPLVAKQLGIFVIQRGKLFILYSMFMFMSVAVSG